MRSPPPPRPTSLASYQSSSPHLPSPLNPYPSFSPPLTSHCTLDNLPAGEMSDTLSPLRERPGLDPIRVCPRPPSPSVPVRLPFLAVPSRTSVADRCRVDIFTGTRARTRTRCRAQTRIQRCVDLFDEFVQFMHIRPIPVLITINPSVLVAVARKRLSFSRLARHWDRGSGA